AARPFRRYSATTAEIPRSIRRTYGQWFDRKITSSAGASAKSSIDTFRPSTEGNRNDGAGVPSGTMNDVTAIRTVSHLDQRDNGSIRILLTSKYHWYFIGPVAVRLRRAAQVERNRELVLDAARRVFLARGYARASLEAIAEEAGFSKGVVYSQFAGKADLLLGLLERRIEERLAENARLAAQGVGLDGLRALMRRNARRAEEAAACARLMIAFRAPP